MGDNLLRHKENVDKTWGESLVVHSKAERLQGEAHCKFYFAEAQRILKSSKG